MGFIKKLIKKVIFYNFFQGLHLRLSNFLFLKNMKKSTSIQLFGQKFYFPKNSSSYQTFFSVFEKDRLPSIKKECDLMNINFFDDKSINIIDVGANLGYQSLAYNHFLNINKHICFEPFSTNFYYLEKNLSSVLNIEVFNFGLGEKESIETISFPAWEEDNSRLSNLGLMSIQDRSSGLESLISENSEKIEIKAFDDCNISFNDDEIIFIKIDVEGFEYNVLLGMKGLIANSKNIFLTIELNPWIGRGNLPQIKSILALLRENEFNSYIEKDNQMVEISDSDLMQLVESKTVDAFFGRNTATI
jgi:FkbM family methyltransferase